MSPVCARSFEMSTAHSPSEPRTTGSSISLPSHLSTAGGSDISTPSFSGGAPKSTDVGRRPRPRDVGIEAHPAWIRSRPGCETPLPMDFDLSDDQVALQAGARELLDALASSARVRAHTETDAGYDAALWAAMTDQGWLGIEVAEERGGVGLG